MTGPLASHTNRKLGGAAPSHYLAKLEEDPDLSLSRQRLDEILRSHLISPDPLRHDDFDTFLQDRARRLLDLIEDAMGRKISGRDADEVVEEFGAGLERSDAPRPPSGTRGNRAFPQPGK